MNKQNLENKGRRQLILLMAMFFVPVILSFILVYSQPSWLKEMVGTDGELIQPPIQLTFEDFTQTKQQFEESILGRWGINILTNEPCIEGICAKALKQMQNLHQILSKDINRVRRTIWLPEGTSWLPTQKFPSLQQLNFRNVLVMKTAHLEYALAPSVIITDPNGLMILRYDMDHDWFGVMRDLKKLLKVNR